MTGQPLKKFGNRLALAFAALLMLGPVMGMPASAQIQTVDPNDAIDADLITGAGADQFQNPIPRRRGRLPRRSRLSAQSVDVATVFDFKSSFRDSRGDFV